MGLLLCLRCLLGPLIGITFALVVLMTSIFGNYIVTLFLPMITIGNWHREWRELMDRAVTFWMVIPLFFLDFVYGVRVRVTGDLVRVDEPAIIIMNHRTRLDWLYFWLALWRMNPWLMTTNRVALKELLRHVPGAGFGMQVSPYIFLKRDLDEDARRMTRAINYYADMERPYQIIMFPEGTDKTEYTTRRSQGLPHLDCLMAVGKVAPAEFPSSEYARKNGLPPLKNLLYPRHSGFLHMFDKMKERNYLTAVYDVTVAYPRSLVQNETDMILKGRLATHVHYDVKRYPLESLPTGEQAMSRWLLDLWSEKDEKLERFYAQRNRLRRKMDASGERNLWLRDNWPQCLVKVFGCLFWVSVVSIWLYHMAFLVLVQVGLAFLVLNYLHIYICHGGIDNLIYYRWERWKAKNAVNRDIVIV